jgi:hypothetical protein
VTRPAKAAAAAKSPASFARVLMTLVALFAFTLQSVITQIHFHDTSTVTSAGGKAAPKNSDSQNCPICQAILHAGHVTQPVAGAIPLPVFTSYALRLSAEFLSIARRPAHSWQSRGPPAH